MATNLTEWKSTIVGLILFALAIVQYWTDESTTWTDHIEDAVLAITGIYFFLAKDKQIESLLNGLVRLFTGWAKKKTGIDS